MSTAFTQADRDLAAQAPPISFKRLHPTFAAEASGVDFGNVTPAVVAAIKLALAEVSSFVLRKALLEVPRTDNRPAPSCSMGWLLALSLECILHSHDIRKHLESSSSARLA